MTHLTRITTTALTLAVVTPAVAFGAAKLDLRGAATLRVVDDGRNKVTFSVDDRIAGRKKGSAVTEGERASIRPAGRHGDDFRYQAVFDRAELEVGKRYEVTLETRGREPRTLRLKLIDAR